MLPHDCRDLGTERLPHSKRRRRRAERAFRCPGHELRAESSKRPGETAERSRVRRAELRHFLPPISRDHHNTGLADGVAGDGTVTAAGMPFFEECFSVRLSAVSPSRPEI